MANSKKALDENGVLYLWGKVKTYVATAIANIKLPSKTSDLTNDSGFITAKDVPEGAAASPAPCPRWMAPLPLVRKPLLPVVTMCTPLTPLRWTRWRARA